MIQHMVLLKFRPGTSDAQIAEALQHLRDMRTRIPGITHLGLGAYSSPEGLNDGYTHGLLVTFDSAAARDAYLPHPEHERVKELVLPVIERVVAFDFEDQP